MTNKKKISKFLNLKDAEEETKKKEWKESAKKELDDWYKKRAEQLGRTHDNNKYGLTKV